MDARAMSGRWQAFFLIIGFSFGFPLVGAIWPIGTQNAIGAVARLAISLTEWALSGISGYILIYGFVIGFLLTVIGGVYIGLEKLYIWIQNWRNDTLDNYKIK